MKNLEMQSQKNIQAILSANVLANSYLWLIVTVFIAAEQIRSKLNTILSATLYLLNLWKLPRVAILTEINFIKQDQLVEHK